jgi:hypothetical protein
MSSAVDLEYRMPTVCLYYRQSLKILFFFVLINWQQVERAAYLIACGIYTDNFVV